jgi:DNA-binding XRE family transcriptional regulator
MSRGHAQYRLMTGSYRVELRLSKADLALRSGLSRVTISKIESGQSVEKVTLLKLLDCLLKEAKIFDRQKIVKEIEDIILNLSNQIINNSNKHSASYKFSEIDKLHYIETSLREYMNSGKLMMLYKEDVQEFCNKMEEMIYIIKLSTHRLLEKS